MNSFHLTASDKAAFETFGFLSFPGLLAHRAQEIIRAFEGVWAERGGGHNGKPHDGKLRSSIVPFIDQSEVLSGLLEDPGIHSILTGLLGDDFNYLGSDGNYYVGDTGWHSDGWRDSRSGAQRAQYTFLKVALYLDPLTKDTGALRVIPGSHNAGTPFADRLQAEISQSKKNWNMDPAQVPAIALETKPGDVVVFNHNTKHAAFGGGTARRMFTINCGQRIAEQDIQIVRDYVSNMARFWLDSTYGPAMLAGPKSRRIHLEQVLANEDHLPALSARKRQEMLEPSRG